MSAPTSCPGCRLLLFQLSDFLKILIFLRTAWQWCFCSTHEAKYKVLIHWALTLSSHLIIPFFQTLIKGGLNKPAPAWPWEGWGRIVWQFRSGTSQTGRAFPFLFHASFSWLCLSKEGTGLNFPCQSWSMAPRIDFFNLNKGIFTSAVSASRMNRSSFLSDLKATPTMQTEKGKLCV